MSNIIEFLIEKHNLSNKEEKSFNLLEYINISEIPLKQRGCKGVKIDKYIKKDI